MASEIKIIQNVPGVEKPTDDIYYVLGSNGTFLNLKNQWCEATVPTNSIAGLEPVQKRAVWKLPPIPAPVFASIAKFFNEVCEKDDCEVGVLLNFNFDTREWLVTVPKQTVSWAHIDYDAFERVPGYRCVGTMHSHVKMGAHHSGTDIKDEAEIDGLHVTVGKVDMYPELDMNAEIVIRGTRFPIDAAKVIAGLEVLGDDEEKETGIRKKWWERANGSYKEGSHVLVDPKPNVPKSWYKQLKVKTYSWGGSWKGYGDGGYGAF